MIKKLLCFCYIILISACSDNPTESSSNEIHQSDIKVEEYHEGNRYKGEFKKDTLNILVQSELSGFKKLEKEIQEELGFKIKFHYRHFFTDYDVVNHENFDASILMKGSSLTAKLPMKTKLGTLGTNRMALIVNPSVSKIMGNERLLTLDSVIDKLKRNNIKVNVSNPAWRLSAHSLWMSGITNNNSEDIESVSSFNHGALGVILDKVISSELSGTWLMESNLNNLLNSFKKQEIEPPFSYYLIKGKQYAAEYEVYSNGEKINLVRKFYLAIRSDKFSSKVEEFVRIKIDNKNNLFYKGKYQNIANESISHELKLNSIDQLINRSYPRVHTFYLFPSSLASEKFHITSEMKNIFNSSYKENKNTLESISRFRNNDSISVYNYSNDINKVAHDINPNEITSIKAQEFFTNPTSNEVQSPYSSLLRLFDAVADYKVANPDVFVKIVFVISSQYETLESTNQNYARFAESYKKLRMSKKELFSIPIDTIAVGEANIENMNGIAGLSGGVTLDSRNKQFKSNALRLRNHY